MQICFRDFLPLVPTSDDAASQHETCGQPRACFGILFACIPPISDACDRTASSWEPSLAEFPDDNNDENNDDDNDSDDNDDEDAGDVGDNNNDYDKA